MPIPEILPVRVFIFCSIWKDIGFLLVILRLNERNTKKVIFETSVVSKSKVVKYLKIEKNIVLVDLEVPQSNFTLTIGT